MDRGVRDQTGLGGGWFRGQYDPAEYNMGAAASARMHTVLDSSGTRKNTVQSYASTSSYHINNNNIHLS